MLSVISIPGILSGCAVGFLLGLIGGGGSVLATPLLLYVVGLQPHVAIGTSAFAVSINAYIGFFNHARARTVRWRSAIIFALAGITGALVGSSLGKAFDGHRLVFLFAFAMILVGLAMLRSPGRSDAERPPEKQGSVVDLTIAVLALLRGLASGFFGIGGGVLIVPALIYSTRMDMINAVGSSLLAVGTFGLLTALNYATSGMVNWTLAVEFVLGGLVGGLLGMRLAVHLRADTLVLKRIFAAFLFAAAGYVFVRSGTNVSTATLVAHAPLTSKPQEPAAVATGSRRPPPPKLTAGHN